jgi:CHAT domain-containing protein
MTEAEAGPEVSIQPLVSWPRQVVPGGSYLVTVDLRLPNVTVEWPYDQEEFVIGCMLDGRPACKVRALGTAGVVLHRFGGTYGPARFIADVSDRLEELPDAALWLTLTTEGGVPFYVGKLPLDKSSLPGVIEEQRGIPLTLTPGLLPFGGAASSSGVPVQTSRASARGRTDSSRIGYPLTYPDSWLVADKRPAIVMAETGRTVPPLGYRELRDRDRRQYHDEAAMLLSKQTWTAADVDQAVLIHDLLEVPEGAPDPVAKRLRSRLIRELRREAEVTGDPTHIVRMEFYRSQLLDSSDALERRLRLLAYRGVTSSLEYQGGGTRGQLDAAIEAFLELDRETQAEGPRAIALLGPTYDSSLIGLAIACSIRYSDRRELLQEDLPADREREIRADLERAIDVSGRVAVEAGSSARAEGLAVLGLCYVYRYEDDPRYSGQETIDAAVTMLQEAVGLAEATAGETGQAPAALYTLLGVRDRLAAAHTARGTLQDVDAAIALYTRNRDEAAAVGFDNLPGAALSLATAWTRRWQLTRESADRDRASKAYAEAFASADAEHLPAAFDTAAQWGGFAWQEHWWAEAGMAYQRAIRVMHLAVRQQGSRSDREWIIRKASGVAARAALSLARAGALDDALVTMETGRAVSLAEMFDRRAIDYELLTSLAGHQVADEYRQLTDELTQVEARLLLAGPHGDAAIAAEVEGKRRRRAALRERMGSAARTTLDAMDGPPTMAELRTAAGPATVVYLNATDEGGLALILRPDGAPVQGMELESLTVAAAMELTAALQHAVDTGDGAVCAEVCEQMWVTVMERVLPEVRDATEVVLIPAGTLAALPWHAAKLPGRTSGYVLDTIAASYMPNVRSLPAARAAWKNMPRQVRALAIEAPEPTSAPPLSTATEIAAIISHENAEFAVTRLPGTDATAERLRDALGHYELLHFAGHASADPNDPLAGALLLAHDETLTIRELLATRPGAARLAVLSASETARVHDPMSDEMVSFPTALIQCGFGGVVGALWAAMDRPTTMLMGAFYEQWQGRRATPREALRAAQQYTRDRRYASPLAWANFVYVGP